ncbi:LINE-1 reverse transcriptase isogeny [Gossypium australe]|uniref:LINE-1 reverse transcriptase isogeny n=1 Tax=Gossypium australe TaxID=47621 RepID=A0A5B6WJB5_9ROSI|nr:LINE-1 reverse transcriptase isogeny [Gossypium australe]
MERMGHVINETVNKKRWFHCACLGRGRIFLIYFFADELLLFYKVNLGQADIVTDILNKFCYYSGQKVNKGEFQIFFSPNVLDELSSAICRKMEFVCTDDLGKYLGMSILHGRSFEFVVKKVHDKLNGWVAKKLSLAGRVTLAKVVLLSILNYFMATAKLPNLAYSEIEKLAQNFIWGSTVEMRKPTLIRWDVCCTPMVVGRLGFQLLTKTKALWVQVVRNKYKVAHEILAKGTRKCLLGNRGLASGSRLDDTLRVSDLVDDNGNWYWGYLRNLLPYSIVLQIGTIVPPSLDVSQIVLHGNGRLGECSLYLKLIRNPISLIWVSMYIVGK